MSNQQDYEYVNHKLFHLYMRFLYKKQEVYLSRTKTALMLNVTLSTLWRWDKENYLTPVRVGGKVMYRESDIQRVINNTKED